MVWEASTEKILQENIQQKLPGSWQLMLLGDGSPTRHLHLLTGKEVTVELINMESELLAAKNAPKEISKLKEPLLRRQVWLKCGVKTLAWAESWWNLSEAKKHLHHKEQPIWRSLTQDRYELFREVDGLALVRGTWLEAKFKQTGPFWSRHYRFFRNKRELTVIREVFSPDLEEWLGPVHRKALKR